MPLQWNGNQAMRAIHEQTARNLREVADILRNQHKLRLGVSGSQSAPRGSYPHKRTGFGQSKVVMSPTSVSAIAKSLSVRVGIDGAGWYLAYLETEGWKGLLDTFADLRSQLAAVAGTPISTRQG